VPAGVLRVPGAILRATRPGEKGEFAQVCAVFDAAGQAIPGARTTARSGPLALPCACPDASGLPLRTGRWLFGGIGFHHFGHALIFSTARLWALDRLDPPPDGILLFDRGTEGGTRPGTTRNLAAILAALGIDLPVVTVGADERVETLLIPEEGISTAKALFCGTPAYRHFLRARIDALPDAPGPRDIYVSRSKLGLQKAGLMFEDQVQAHLAAAGYQVFHPQLHPLATQIATYRGAARIIGVDGSALHVVAMAARPGTRVAVLGRRPFYPGAIAEQVRAIGGADAIALMPARATYADRRFARSAYPWFWSHALPDMAALGRQLAGAGFLDGVPDWPQPGPEAVADRLAYIARKNATTLVPLTRTEE
jgi:hypothetical protein